MDTALGTIVLAAALGVLVRSRARNGLRRLLRIAFRRALPGACTGRSDGRPTSRPAPYDDRWQWTEVVNLPSAKPASRPHGNVPSPPAAERALAETR